VRCTTPLPTLHKMQARGSNPSHPLDTVRGALVPALTRLSAQHRDQRRSSILTVLRPLHLIVRQPRRSASYLRRVLAPLLARLRANEDRRTTFLARKTARRASLTASDLGNTAAISGWSATSVVPVSRPAYLPRTPGPSAAKSYSGRRSSGRRRLSFFIGAALTTRGCSGRD
jgi:hypothetical protein